MNLLIFEIQTIPDVEGGQRVFNLEGLDDSSTVKALNHLHKQKTGEDELPLYLRKIVAISVIQRGMGDNMDNEVTLESLGKSGSSETELLSLFHEKIKERNATLVSWNGTSQDLPIIHYRTLKNKLSAPDYLERTQKDSSDEDSLDLMHAVSSDALINEQAQASVTLHALSVLLGFPKQAEMSNAEVWEQFQSGDITEIRQYCESNVVSTYLIYLRYQLMQGKLDAQALDQELSLLKDTLKKSAKDHLKAFSRIS